MRKFLLPLLISFSGICLAQSPITITSSMMPAVGDTLFTLRDTMVAGFNIGPSGANVNWNFSNLTPDTAITTYAVAPSATPYASDFPNANLALTNDNVFYLYYRNTPTALKIEGFANIDPNLGTVAVNYNPIPDQYRFTTAYQNSFSGNSGFQEAKPYNQLPPNIQSQITSGLGICPNPAATVSQVRVTVTSTFTDDIDAWGKVTTPIGTYDALRRKRVENTRTVIEAQSTCFFVSNWIPIVDTTTQATEHSWLNTLTKLPLILPGYDNARNITSVTYSATPPPPIAAFTWNNASGGLVSFTNNSQNSPTTYSWDFGDSNSSNQQSPNHTYAANGTYYVCLTVSNASGNDTYCDSVDVTKIGGGNNPPVAVDDAIQITYPDSAVLNVLTNDSDPDNDNLSIAFVLQASNGTTSKLTGGMVKYKANANFRGVDSFQYIIQDDGSPILRDTATVVVTVVGKPFADFSYTISGLQVTFMNLSTGATSVAWNLGDGNTDVGNTVVHTYATKTVYNVCLVATNSYGSDTICKNVDLNNVGISSEQIESIKLYPNPTTGLVKIQSDFKTQTVEVIDISGRSRLVLNDFTTAQFDVSSLPSGFYFVRLIDSNGNQAVSKIIKE